MPTGWLQVIRGPRPPAARHLAKVRRSPQTKTDFFQPVVPQDERRQKPSEAHAAASTRVSRLQGGLANLGPDDTEERKVHPVEDQIAMSEKFLERAKKLLVIADTEPEAAAKKKSQCEQKIAEADADLARLREEPSVSGEDSKTEVQQLRAQLAEIRDGHVRGSEEAAEFAPRLLKSEPLVVQKMFCPRQHRIWLVG